MRLYHELSGTLKEFQLHGDAVTMYICGVTPYDTTHLGHAFTYATFDVLLRYLESLGHTVRYVQNVTDIDDDILRKANEEGENWLELGNRWTAHFIRDMKALNVVPPDVFVRATETVEEIVEAVQSLIEAGVAYEAGGSVYFHIDDWPEYGKLSRIPRDEMLPIANERGNIPDDENKKDPLDFVLWQAQAPDEPAWDSPWGPGRPGWHIECSTMSSQYLGDTIDFHGGGADLIFPHHESEIAQAENATGESPFVRFWFHTAMVYYEGEKMSKSLGNLIMVRDLLQDWSADGVRLYMASHHYRQPWGHTDEELAAGEKLAQDILKALAAPTGNGRPLDSELARAAFKAAMDNDLNTPAALLAMAGLASDIRRAAEVGQDVEDAQVTLREMSSVFGLQLDRGQPEHRVSAGWEAQLKRFT
jgi:L-cysteine:1D-myo-inositol 2-amino-2-deoxy-alpha-D-glucopyranoside ligase